MKQELITVVETASFVTDAKVCMTNEERTEAINMIAAKAILLPVAAASERCGLLSAAGGKAVE